MSSPPHNDSSTSLRRYNLTLTTTSASLSVNITYILSWVNDALEYYIKHEKLSTIQNLTSDWQDGRAFLCLAHRFYPSSITDSDFDNLITQKDGQDIVVVTRTRSSLAFSVFERELTIVPPSLIDPQTSSSSYPLYITKVRQALLPLNQTGIRNHTDNDTNDLWTQRTQTVLDTLQHTRQQLQSLGFHSSSRNDSPKSLCSTLITSDNDDHNNNTNNEQLSINDDDTSYERSRTTSGWEDDLGTMEQLLLDLHRIMDEYHSWAIESDDNNTTPTRAEKDRRLGLIQSVEEAHQSFQDYLEHDQHVLTVFRKRALFTQATAPIRQDLDWVQAEMLKTTTTDNGIKELEARVRHAGILLQQLIQQHSQDSDDSVSRGNGVSTDLENMDGDDEQQQVLYGTEIDALVKKHQLVQSWVANIRVWFVEAQRIRQWIGERIDKLETTTIPDGVLDQELSVTADQVEDFNTCHEALEKEVELFDKDDMSRLRTHVKDLTVVTTKEKDLSPADTTTIEITFTTLMTLDRLMHLLHRRSYHLQVLTLRVFWENEFLKTIEWVHSKAQELELFIKTQARWQDDTDQDIIDTAVSVLKSIVIDKLLEFELDISTFDQGQFTTTVNLYQEMDDTSEIELPSGLESRQVNVEETFEVLVHRTTFARQVVEQFLMMTDFMDAGDRLLYHFGDHLYEKLTQQTSKVYSLFLDQHNDEKNGTIDLGILDEQPLVDENAEFQEQAVRLITDTASLIPFTETTFASGQEENEAGNDRVESAVKARSSELLLFGESLEYKLDQLRLGIQWHTKLTDLYSDLCYIQDRIDDDIQATFDLVGKVVDSFGDQVPHLPEDRIHDKDTIFSWDRQLQHYVDKIGTYQTRLGMVDNYIQDLLDFYETSPSSTTDDLIQATVTDTIRYLEGGGELAASQLQSLASTLDQWKSGLSTAKARQTWEERFLVVTRWMAAHEKKWQHTRQESAWSPTKDLTLQKKHNDHLCQVASSLEQEWCDFKEQSITLLKEAFGLLTSGPGKVLSSLETAWATQEQRQDGLIYRVGKVDGILALVMALIAQRKTITQFLMDSQQLQSHGTNWLDCLETSVLHSDYQESQTSDQLTVDTYNKKVDDLWAQWQSFDINACFSSVREYHDNVDLLDGLDQQCDSVQKEASHQHDTLLALGRSLEQWKSTVMETDGIRCGVKLWNEKIHSLDARVMDCLEQLTVDKDALLSRLVLDHAIITSNDESSVEDDSLWSGMEDRVKGLDSMVRQWENHSFIALYADGSDLKARRTLLMQKLLDLSGDNDKKPLDLVTGVEDVENRLDQAKHQCVDVAKPLLSFILDMMDTSSQLDDWKLTWTDLSLTTESLQGRLDDVLLDKEQWMQGIHDSDSLATLQDLSETATVISREIQTTLESHANDSLLDLEHAAFVNMEQSYYHLSTHQLWKNLEASSSLVVPMEIQAKHDQCQQSIEVTKSMVKDLTGEIKWLEIGVTWIHRVDKQLELCETTIDYLKQFSEQNARWTPGMDLITSIGNTISNPLGLDTTLGDLQQRVEVLINDVNMDLDTLHDWELTRPCRDKKVRNFGLDGLDLWQQKADQLEDNRRDVRGFIKHASDLVDHQKAVWQWSQNMSLVEIQGEQLKADLLLENGDTNSVDGEPLELVTDFDDKLARVLHHAQNIKYPDLPTLSSRHLSALTSTVMDGSKAINKYIHSRHEYLKDLSISLHCILNENERSAHLKALVDGHVAKAEESLLWMMSTNDKLQQLITNEADSDELELLEARLTKMHELEKGAIFYAYTSNNGLMESANHCKAAIQLDLDNNKQVIKDSNNGAMQLERVASIQKQVDNEWKRLSQSLQQHDEHLKKDIQQAKCVYWNNQAMQKCQAINDQLKNISKSRLEDLQDEELDQWRHAISDIKSNDLAQLQKLSNQGTIEYLHGTDAIETHQQLEVLLQSVRSNVEHQRQKTRYIDLATTLINSADDTKDQLKELLLTCGTLGMDMDALADEAHYERFKKQRDTLLDDWTPYEDMYKQEGEQFLSLHGNERDVDIANTIDDQHQRLLKGMADLQQQIARVDAHYDMMIQQRPILDTLHHSSSLLDDIDTRLDRTEVTDLDDGMEEDLDRAKEMMMNALTTLEQKRKQQIESTVTDVDGRTGFFAAMDDIYEQRHNALLNRVDIISQQLVARQEKQKVQQARLRYQSTADGIKASVEKEVALLESARPRSDDLPGTTMDTSFGPQQYQQWAKKVASSEQVLRDLNQDAKSMIMAATSMDGLQQEDVNELQNLCQTSLDDLKQHIQYQQFHMDLVRRVLGHSKSADNITSWLAHFAKAVDGISTTVSTLDSLDSDGYQKLENEISGLEAKQQSFEPIMGSLENLNTTIQGIHRLNTTEDEFAAHSKRLTQQQFDKVDLLWKESVVALETVKKTAIMTLQATTITGKIESLMATMDDTHDQVEQMKDRYLLVSADNLPADDGQQEQQKQRDLFKTIPRKHNISASLEKLAVMERGLIEERQNHWAEINQLVDQYNDGQRNCNNNDECPFLEKRDRMDSTWSNTMEAIHETKLSLSGKKDIGNYLSILDDIDILLDSMDDVILKASPDYQATMIGNKYSKAELKAKLIELNARYNYYKLNIQQKTQRADDHWTKINKDNNHQQQEILARHRLAQHARWKTMTEQQVPSRQLSLKRGLENSQNDTERKPRIRKTSLPTRKAAGTLIPSPPRMSSPAVRPPKATLKPSSSSSSAEVQASNTLQGHQRLRTVASSSALVNSKKSCIRQRVSSSTSTASSLKTTDTACPTFSVSKKKSISSLTTRKRPNSYVAQADNALDVEIGRIVNETPYRIKVKMVPGEVGRYWFGDVNPKLVYCRVLKSKMVMVRVGGGWTELSQFLRDHALLEGELIIPKQQSQQLLHTPIQEGYLEATTSLQRQRQQLLQQHLDRLQQQKQNQSLRSASPILSSLPTMNKSRSTPPHLNGLLQQRGYKDGDRFFAVDRHGNQLEVKMTRFRQKGGVLPTSTTNRRRKVARS